MIPWRWWLGLRSFFLGERVCDGLSCSNNIQTLGQVQQRRIQLLWPHSAQTLWGKEFGWSEIWLLYNVPYFRLGLAEMLGQMWMALRATNRERERDTEKLKRRWMQWWEDQGRRKKRTKKYEDWSVRNAFKKTQTLAPLWSDLLSLPLWAHLHLIAPVCCYKATLG